MGDSESKIAKDENEKELTNKLLDEDVEIEQDVDVANNDILENFKSTEQMKTEVEDKNVLGKDITPAEKVDSLKSEVSEDKNEKSGSSIEAVRDNEIVIVSVDQKLHESEVPMEITDAVDSQDKHSKQDNSEPPKDETLDDVDATMSKQTLDKEISLQQAPTTTKVEDIASNASGIFSMAEEKEKESCTQNENNELPKENFVKDTNITMDVDNKKDIINELEEEALDEKEERDDIQPKDVELEESAKEVRTGKNELCEKSYENTDIPKDEVLLTETKKMDVKETDIHQSDNVLENSHDNKDALKENVDISDENEEKGQIEEETKEGIYDIDMEKVELKKDSDSSKNEKETAGSQENDIIQDEEKTQTTNYVSSDEVKIMKGSSDNDNAIIGGSREAECLSLDKEQTEEGKKSPEGEERDEMEQGKILPEDDCLKIVKREEIVIEDTKQEERIIRDKDSKEKMEDLSEKDKECQQISTDIESDIITKGGMEKSIGNNECKKDVNESEISQEMVQVSDFELKEEEKEIGEMELSKEDLQESQNENEEIEIKVQVLEKEEDRFSAIEEKEEIADEKMESILPG